jgi:hypothetical protein
MTYADVIALNRFIALTGHEPGITDAITGKYRKPFF